VRASVAKKIPARWTLTISLRFAQYGPSVQSPDESPRNSKSSLAASRNESAIVILLSTHPVTTPTSSPSDRFFGMLET
jgi:hypothetical protein